MDLARLMIRTAKYCGADVAKFQVYDPVRLLDPEHPLLKPHWDTICATELMPEQVGMLKATCDTLDIEFLASVFHPSRVSWLEDVGVQRYKIASRSLYDEDLAAAIASTGKPVLRSWGSYDGRRPPFVGGDVKELYCVSEYPTPLEHIDMAQFAKFARGGGPPYVGFSDHTVGLTAAAVAMAHGARIIEKHFTLDRDLPGPDHVCSATPEEMVALCQMRNEMETILYT
jgi:N-acetylneuraminate synthase/N,N'-diacetyllegionaminate synthase